MKPSTALCMLLFTWTAFTWSATAQTRSPIDLANTEVPPGARRFAYGADPLPFGELRLPSTKGPHPAALSHFVFIDPQSDVWPQVMAAVRRLLAKAN